VGCTNSIALQIGQIGHATEFLHTTCLAQRGEQRAIGPLDPPTG
jgi:hypothetical protein